MTAVSELHKFLFDGVPVRGALVRLTTPIRPGESEVAAEARLQAMLAASDIALARALPGE